jgi:hypothetical protein
MKFRPHSKRKTKTLGVPFLLPRNKHFKMMMFVSGEKRVAPSTKVITHIKQQQREYLE